jgi:hypothetical protein
MSNITEDFNILRKQVSLTLVDDTQLKIIFKHNKYDLVLSLLEIENTYFNNKTYILDKKPEKDIAHQKIEELRNIVNEKDKLMEKIKANAGN